MRWNKIHIRANTWATMKKHKRFSQRRHSKSVQNYLQRKECESREAASGLLQGLCMKRQRVWPGSGSYLPVSPCTSVRCEARSSAGAVEEQWRSWEELRGGGSGGRLRRLNSFHSLRAAERCQVPWTTAITLPVMAFKLKGALEKRSHYHW